MLIKSAKMKARNKVGSELDKCLKRSIRIINRQAMGNVY